MENKFYFQPKNEMAMIKAAIFELGLTQKNISREIGKPESVLSEVLRGKKRAYPTLCLLKSFLAIEILNRKGAGNGRR